MNQRKVLSVKYLLAFSSLAVTLIAIAAAGQSSMPTFPGSDQKPSGGEIRPVQPEVRVVGVVQKEIADSSPIASGKLIPIKGAVKVGSVVKLHFILNNLSNANLEYSGDVLLPLDVRDSDGNLPPETYFGCASHFFSPCHFEITGPSYATPPHITIPAHGKFEHDLNLTSEYKLGPGTYTVLGYVCGISKGLQCFKTNTVTVTIE